MLMNSTYCTEISIINIQQNSNTKLIYKQEEANWNIEIRAVIIIDDYITLQIRRKCVKS